MLKAQLAKLLHQADTVKIDSQIPYSIDAEGGVTRLSMYEEREDSWFVKDQEVSLDAQGQVHVIAFKTEKCDAKGHPCVLEFFMHRPFTAGDFKA